MRTSCSEVALAKWVEDARQRWPSHELAVAHLESVRWNGMPTCTYCGSFNVFGNTEMRRRMPRWHCTECQRSFSVTVGTIFHHTHLPMTTWFIAISAMLNARKTVRAMGLCRTLELPYQTAWHLTRRIRYAMFHHPEQAQLLREIAAINDTYRCMSS